MNAIRIIGIGSPYGDDQLGWKVIDVLENSFFSPSVSLLRCETPVTDLLNYLKHAEFVVLVDAIHADLAIGQICSWSQLALLPETSVSSHGMNLMTLLQLAENLGQSPKQWIVCGIVADSEHLLLHDSLSPAVAEAMPKLLSYIQQVCSAYSESTI